MGSGSARDGVSIAGEPKVRFNRNYHGTGFAGRRFLHELMNSRVVVRPGFKVSRTSCIKSRVSTRQVADALNSINQIG